MNNPRGSLWRKWDLHVHTPCSIVQNYGGDTKENWEKFITDLENLPSEIEVLGINDYLFIDGCKKILKAINDGRLANIKLILPVIELRLDKFGGTDSKLSRVNFHIIFSNSIELDIIEQQFINALPSSYQLSPEYEYLKSEWKGLATKESLIDLGTRIIESVPEKEKSKFGSPLKEGFNNINFRLDDILNRLDSTYFKGNFLTAVGKTEWWDIKWNDKSIADKKTIINQSDIVFISAENITNFHKAKEHLSNSNVNDRLLDCSDAHNYSHSKQKDRLGKCFTWVKGDPTFEGLKLSLVEPKERIHVGEAPETFKTVEKNPTKYIKSIHIHKQKGSKFKERWFDTEIDLNHGLVAIIGNKGSGKSALTDVIGLLGHSRNQEAFSFLNPDKFKKLPDDRSQYFEAKLFWESDEIEHAFINADVDERKMERVKYIPQNYFEHICTELGKIEETAFDKEIKDVIFSHVDKADRLDQANLNDLINYRSSEIYKALGKARLIIQGINKKIVDCEKRLTDEHKETIKNQLKAKAVELEAHEKSEPEEVLKPEKTDQKISDQIKGFEDNLLEILADIENKEEERIITTKSIRDIELLLSKIENFETDFASFKEGFEELAEDLGIKFEEVITFEVKKSKIEDRLTKLEKAESNLIKELDKQDEKGLHKQVAQIEIQLKELKENLDLPNKEYKKYLDELKEWEEKRKEIIGNKNDIGSLSYIQEQLNRIEDIPSELDKLYNERLSKSRGIYRKIKQQKNVLANLYAPIQIFFESHKEISKKLDLQFDVSVINAGFQNRFFEWVSRSVSGSFIGIKEGSKLLDNLVQKHDFNNETSTLNFLELVNEHLNRNVNVEGEPKIKVNEQLKMRKTVESLYDYIFSLEYLEPRYVLKLGEKDLGQLSPGERGALLIIFYLLIDKDNKPLIIDQPEHNLDNETVTNLLVPAMKKAKLKRQLIIITHNPILAVVCNADQIICASLDIKEDYAISYETGAIENPEINRRIVDVLEGTIVAFDNRQRKYLREFFEAYSFYFDQWSMKEF